MTEAERPQLAWLAWRAALHEADHREATGERTLDHELDAFLEWYAGADWITEDRYLALCAWETARHPQLETHAEIDYASTFAEWWDRLVTAHEKGDRHA